MNSVTFTNRESVKFRTEKIVDGAYDRLDKHPHFRRRRLGVRVYCEDLVLILEGQLPSYYLKQVLQAALRDLEGIPQVRNDVEVFNPSEPLSGIQSLQEKESNNVENKNQTDTWCYAGIQMHRTRSRKCLSGRLIQRLEYK